MITKTQRVLIVLFGLLVLAPVTVLGQSIDELCREFVTQAFSSLGSNCASLEEGSACYGYGEVSPTFYVDSQPRQVLDNALVSPADRAALLEGNSTLESFEAPRFALDQSNVNASAWGVTVQQVGANLPRQLLNDGIANEATFILFGGARLENAVYPEDAVVLADPVEVSYDVVTLFTSPANLGYMVQSEEVTTLSGGGTLEADGISPDGAWVRVYYRYEREFLAERATAWVQVDSLLSSAGIENLPVMGPEDYTAMQSTYLTTDVQLPDCSEAGLPPGGLLVQGPERIETEILVNEVPVRVTSTAFLRNVADRLLEVTAVNGIVELFFEGDNAMLIPPGFTGIVCLTEPLDLGIDAQENDRQVERGCPEEGVFEPSEQGLNVLRGLNNIPPNIVNYPPVVAEIVCFSTVGGARCEVRLNLPDQSRIDELCRTGRLPERVCAILIPSE